MISTGTSPGTFSIHLLGIRDSVSFLFLRFLSLLALFKTYRQQAKYRNGKENENCTTKTKSRSGQCFRVGYWYVLQMQNGVSNLNRTALLKCREISYKLHGPQTMFTYQLILLHYEHFYEVSPWDRAGLDNREGLVFHPVPVKKK